MKTYKVATFCEPGETKRSRVRAYSLWYNQGWSGCVVFEVEAEDGKAAKREAIRRRLEYEAAREVGR